MSLSAEQAKTIAEYALTDYEYERGLTRNVIAALPAGHEDYKPDPKSMAALDLAWHIVSSEKWLIDGACAGKFADGEHGRPAELRNAQDVLAWYEKNLAASLGAARGLSGEQLARNVDFMGKMQMPAVTILIMAIKHSVHHRGQLSTYLRPTGGKVPGIYGPSADTQ